VIAESFERIHRSNLIGMGVLPLQFAAGENVASLGLTGAETFDFGELEDGGAKQVTVTARADDGAEKQFEATVRLDTPIEVTYLLTGGILQTVLRKLKKG
jgi:aconitate hydratase